MWQATGTTKKMILKTTKRKIKIKINNNRKGLQSSKKHHQKQEINRTWNEEIQKISSH